MVSIGLDASPGHVLANSIIFIILCPSFVVLRFLTRLKSPAKLGVDDWLTIPALVMVLGCAANLATGVSLNLYGYPMPAPSNPEDIGNSTSYMFTAEHKLQWAFIITQLLAMGFIKLSFIFFSRRIFVKNRARCITNIVTLIMIVVVILWMLAFLFWAIFNCETHFSARWRTLDTLRAHCPTSLRTLLAISISDLITDVMVLILPIPLIIRLRMSLGQKIGVLGIFSLGMLAFFAQVTRLIFFIHDTTAARKLKQDRKIDESLTTTQGLYWAMLECGLALIACCLPTLSALFRRRDYDNNFISDIQSGMPPQSTRPKPYKFHMTWWRKEHKSEAKTSDRQYGSGSSTFEVRENKMLDDHEKKSVPENISVL